MQTTGSAKLGFVRSRTEPVDLYRTDFYRSLPEAVSWDASEVDAILAKADKINFPSNSVLLTPDIQCDSFIILIEGSIRVFQNEREGRELTLYRVRPGEFCILSLNSLLKNEKFNATACTETPVRALSISKEQFLRMTLSHEAFFLRVMESLTGHFSKMLSLMNDLAFSRLEHRLTRSLQTLGESNGRVLKVTHLELANELGATREVVSRILKNLENQGCIKLARGKICLESDMLAEKYQNA